MPFKILFHCLDGAGHLSAGIGLCQALASRGHQVISLLNVAHKGQFAKFDIPEIILTRSSLPPEDRTVNPIKVLADMILNSGLLNGKPTIEKMRLEHTDDSFMINLYGSTVDFNPQIEKIIEEEKPDLFILDHFLIPPAVLKSKVPWIYLYSSNPLALYNNSGKLPPYGSGYHTSSDPATWPEYTELFHKALREPFQLYQTKLYEHFNYKPTEQEATIEEHTFFLKSNYLNIYGYPKELDYDDITPIPEKTLRVDAFCREDTSSVPLEIPKEFLEKPGKTIYFSMGSMGSIDIDLMKRVLQLLEKTPYKCIVSKGVRAEEYELPANCWGQEYLPQTRILSLVDLVITHGGNNTTTEAFCFGKPMIVFPLFSDQYDNAQRVQEKGFGVRLNPYKFTDEELLEAIEKLLNDSQLDEKLKKAAKRIKEENSKAKACEEIERLLENEWAKGKF